jgi:hypothetical protein
MAIRKPRPKEPRQSAVDLAIAAIEESPSVMDMPMTGFDPSPGALDLPDEEQRQAYSRRGEPAVDSCPECGCPLCEECVDEDED